MRQLGSTTVIILEIDSVTLTKLTETRDTAKIEVDSSLVGGPQQSGVTTASSSSVSPAAASSQQKKRPIPLNSEDKLFENLRDTNFAIVGNLLNKVARRLNDDYEGRHQAKTVSEIREFVGKLGSLQQEHQSLRLHTGLAEEIMKHTRSDIFNRILEVQQSRPFSCHSPTTY